jgi:hypothetical protein
MFKKLVFVAAAVTALNIGASQDIPQFQPPIGSQLYEFFDGGHHSPMHDNECSEYDPGAELNAGGLGEVTTGNFETEMIVSCFMRGSIAGPVGSFPGIRTMWVEANSTETLPISRRYQTSVSPIESEIEGEVILQCFDPMLGDVELNNAQAVWFYHSMLAPPPME